MADKKISALTSASPATDSDAIPIARAGSSFQLAASDLLVRTGNLTFTADSDANASGDLVFKLGSVERLRIINGGALQVSTALNLDTSISARQLQMSQTFVQPSAGTTINTGVSAEATVRGTGAANAVGRYQGFVATIKDAAAVANWTVSGAANNGSGLIRITLSSATTLVTGDPIAVYGVTGTTEANGRWVVTVIDSTHVDLQGSTFTNAYVSGGTLTNRGSFYGTLMSVGPSLTRLGFTGTAANGDDVCAYGAYNSGTAQATSGYVVNHNAAFGGNPEFLEGIEIECNANYGIRMIGAYTWGLDFYGSGVATYTGGGAMRLPNNVGVYGRNAANSADLEMFAFNTLNEVQFFNNARFSALATFDGSMSISDAGNVALGSTNGTRFGTATTQKIGFFNAVPVTQPNGTGNVHTVAAGSTTSVFTNTTFDGSTGSTAYTVGDIVKALKSVGLLAA